MAGYTRNDTSNNIATGNVINAADLDGEFDALVAAFHASTGHTHDGTAANGAPITKIGPAQDLVISTGAITPKTDNTVDLGSSSFEFKDLYIDGTANIDALVADTADINAGTIDGTAIGANSASTGAFTTLSASSTVTLSGGTADGVLYLNGSKVATSGSALTFDGSTFSVAGEVRANATFRSSDGTNIGIFGSNVLASGVIGVTSSNNIPLAFGVAATEQMRLTSTGLGVGTSSPAYKLHVQNSAANTDTFVGQSSTVGLFTQWRYNATAASAYGEISTYGGNNSVYIQAQSGGGNTILNLQSGNVGIGTSSPTQKLTLVNNAASTYLNTTDNTVNTIYGTSTGLSAGLLGTLTNHPLIFYANNAEKMRLDSSGNLGLGVTPSAWGSGYKAFEFGNSSTQTGALFSNGINDTWFVSNAYFNGTNWIYKASGYATGVEQAAGAHKFYTAPSGTAGNAITFTQAMTLTAAGRLGIGQTSPGVALSVAGASEAWQLALTTASGTSGVVIGSPAADVLAFGNWVGTERARIDNSGNLLVGTTSGSGDRIYASGYIRASSGFKTDGTTWIDSPASETMRFVTNNTERARITSGGDLLVGTTSAVHDTITNGFVVVGTSAVTAIGIGHVTGSGSGTNYASFNYNGASIGSISQNGTTAVAYNTSSDYRLKDNPQPLTNSGAFIDALKPKTWEWKTDGSRGVGFIAHEVQEVSPGSVVGEKDGEQMQAMEYGSAEFIANIIAELQSLRQRVALLEGN